MIDQFHAHLDQCKQCREQPFNLCRVGASLLTGSPQSNTTSPAVVEPVPLASTDREREAFDAQHIVLTMLWQSVSGWMNRPDYFDTNDLILLADLAYWAQVDNEGLSAAFRLYEYAPLDLYSLCCDLQRKGSAARGVLEYLQAQKDIAPMCDLTKYTKWHEESTAEGDAAQTDKGQHLSTTQSEAKSLGDDVEVF